MRTLAHMNLNLGSGVYYNLKVVVPPQISICNNTEFQIAYFSWFLMRADNNTMLWWHVSPIAL
jgi:hypothetical protein